MEIESTGSTSNFPIESPRKVVHLSVQPNMDMLDKTNVAVPPTPSAKTPMAQPPQRSQEDLQPMRLGDIVFLEGVVGTDNSNDAHGDEEVQGFLVADSAFTR